MFINGGLYMCGRYQLDYGIDQLMFMFDAQNRFIGYGAKQEIFPTDLVAIITIYVAKKIYHLQNQ